MKIFDYVKASKAKKTLGNQFAKDIDTWKQKHKQMVEEFNNSSYKSIHLKSDIMPAEQLIFYNLSGSKVLNEYSIFSIDTTVIDNAYDFTYYIYPTHILVKDKNKQKDPATIDSTTLYRIKYNKKSNYPLQQYEVETVISNPNNSTNKLFPELFCTLKVTNNALIKQAQKELSYYPLVNDPYLYNNPYLQQLEDISLIYENNILPTLKKFVNNPNFSTDISREF